jgi:hypothetical protein
VCLAALIADYEAILVGAESANGRRSTCFHHRQLWCLIDFAEKIF